MATKKYLKSHEAGRYLGVSRSSVTNWVKQGELEGGATPGGHFRFTVEDLDAFARKRNLVIPAENAKLQNEYCLLVVDDEEDFRVFVREAMEVFSGYDLREATDGMQAALVIGSWRPDLIILDLRMPNMNGIELLRLIKSDPKTADLKVVVASAHLAAEARADAEELGVKYFLEKPVRLAKLVATVGKISGLDIQ